MKENISKNRSRTTNIAQSCEIMLPIPIEDFDAESNKNPSTGERFDKLLRNTMEHSYICNECGLKFSTKQDLSDHYPIHWNQENNEFPELLEDFADESNEYIEPVCEIREECDAIMENQCRCGSVFATKEDLLNHFIIHPSHENSVSEESGENRLVTTEIMHSSEVILPDPFDAKSSKNPSVRKMCEILTHSKENNLMCKCGSVFYTKQSLLNHFTIHSNQGNSVCKESWSAFSDKNKVPANTSEESFICEVCGKSFRNAKCLRSHFRTHSNIRPYICSICKEGFKWKGNLTSHLRIHTKDKPYTCPVCSEGFSRKGNLKSHLLTHFGEKPYTCEFCGMKFVYRSNKTEHLRIHTNDKPYVCQICDKGFARGTHLKLHLRVHTKEKPYVCEVCSKAFSDKGYLNRHILIHTKEKSYVCEVCSKRFSRGDNLKAHLLTHSK